MGLRGAVWTQSGVSGAAGFVGRVEMGSGDQQNNSAPMKTTLRQQSGWLSRFLPLPAQWSPVLGPVCEIVPINWTRESWELGPLSSCLDLCIISAGRRHRCHCHHICHEDTNREETFTQSSETYFPFIYYLTSTRECPHIYYLSIPSPATRSRWIIITDANLISYQITDLTDLLMTTWAQMVASCPSVDIYLDV